MGVPNSVLAGLIAAYPGVAPYVTQGANGYGSVIYPGQTPRIYWNFANTQTGNIDTTYANGPSFAKYDSVGTSITLDWQINNDLKFKSITGWRQINWNIGTDLDGEPESMQEVTDSQHQHQISQEFQLNGKARQRSPELCPGSVLLLGRRLRARLRALRHGLSVRAR